jgi:hypothetical protein
LAIVENRLDLGHHNRRDSTFWRILPLPTELADGLRLEGVFLKRVLEIRPKNWFLRFELETFKIQIRLPTDFDFPSVFKRHSQQKTRLSGFCLLLANLIRTSKKELLRIRQKRGTG